MDSSQRQQLSELVEDLTTSGQMQLNQDKMKKLKNICRVSNECIDHVYHSAMSQLNQDHAEIRLSAFQVISELFSRSHHFRTLLVENFQVFLELTVETDTEQPLPPPKEAAKKLRSQAIQTIQSWQASYGSAYKKLALGYHFLKQVKKVDFQDAEARTVAERRREEERSRKMETIYRARVQAAAAEMEESSQDIEAALTEMDSCMKLLFPDFSPSDFLSARSSSDSKPDPDCPSEGDEPCCSKDLQRSRRGGHVQEEEREKGDEENITRKEGRGMAGEEREDAEFKEHRDRRVKECEMESDEEEESVDEGSFIRNSGLVSYSYSLNVSLGPALRVEETDDNEPVVSTMMELHQLLTTKYLPAVNTWVQVFTKSHAEPQLLRRALDLKKSLEAAVNKHKELNIDHKSRIRKVMTAPLDDDEEEDDFEEVPEKEGYEPHIPEHLRAEYGLDPSPSTSAAPLSQHKPPAALLPSTSSSSSRRLKRLQEEEQDPTSAASTLRLLRQKFQSQPSSSLLDSTAAPSGSDQKAAEVPVVPFGLDLYYWGQEQPNAGKIIKSTSQHQFWVPAEVEEEVENKDLLASSRSRYISFPGTFIPVDHFCRAPLGNGKLCQRQDRIKCPFHGRIVPRDSEGRPCREEDRRREEEERRKRRKRREQQPDWRDPELMRDIEAATGEDLGSDHVPGKKRKGKKKYPNLSDLKQSSNTLRSRLEKKIFNKSALRRVAQVMRDSDRRKHDKFSNQFNYALN
ncbi:UV-stimulated scaffold protein A isoform X2 [Nothobranchius furzeri]